MLDQKIWGKKVLRLSAEDQEMLKNHKDLAFGKARKIINKVDEFFGLAGSEKIYKVDLTIKRTEVYYTDIEKEFVGNSKKEALEAANKFILSHAPDYNDDYCRQESSDEELEYIEAKLTEGK